MIRVSWMLLASCALLFGVAGCEGSGDDDSADDDVADDDAGDDDTAWGVEALEQVEAKVGTYTGDFEMFGLDESDISVTAMTWADTAVATNPRIEGDRAQVDVHDTMVVDDGATYERDWLEGVMIEPDGSAGQGFMEMEGVVTLFTEVEPDHFEYETALEDYDFYNWSNITAANLVTGRHVTTKFVIYPGGVETHEITRMTYLEYTDASGSPVAVDYLSMIGTHTKAE